MYTSSVAKEAELTMVCPAPPPQYGTLPPILLIAFIFGHYLGVASTSDGIDAFERTDRFDLEVEEIPCTFLSL